MTAIGICLKREIYAARACPTSGAGTPSPPPSAPGRVPTPLGDVELVARDFCNGGVLDEIVSVRYNAGRPTLFATNYPRPGTIGWEFKSDGQSAENLEQRIGPRIFSRLHEMCDLIDVDGPDQRKDHHELRSAAESLGGRPRPARG